ncbi:MAG: V-type ATPase subunit [Spirochaetaceae bacterium]|jgi:hypothetical protein|nr:V-type ATPase subunit [Spirochaetaceae bacterium]
MKGARAYLYAKACGIIARSFVEGRVNRLAAVSGTKAFEDLVFGDAVSGETGATMTIDAIEKRLGQREDEAIAKISKSFPHSEPPALFQMLVKGDRYGQVVSDEAAARGDADDENGESSITRDISGIARQNSAYYTALWHELEKTPLSDRRFITNIIAEEIRLKNAAWALRLRVYYSLSPEQIKAFLIMIKPGKNKPTLYADALKSLEPDIEEEAQWHSWRLWKYVNKPVSSQYWKIDPRFFQNQASLYLYRLARKALRRSPFTLDTACCFIKLQQFEKEVLTSVAEAVRLGLTGADALEILGLSGPLRGNG